MQKAPHTHQEACRSCAGQYISQKHVIQRRLIRADQYHSELYPSNADKSKAAVYTHLEQFGTISEGSWALNTQLNSCSNNEQPACKQSLD